MSIRLRLTLLYSAILGVTLVAFAVFVYALLQRNLTQTLDSSLRASVAPMARYLSGSSRASDPNRQSDRDDVARIVALRNGTLPTSPNVPGPDTYVQATDTEGDVLFRTPNLISDDLTLPATSRRLRPGAFATVSLNGQDVRLFILPLRFSPAVTGLSGSGFLEAARPLTEVEGTLAHLRAILALGVIGALLVAGAAGWALATTALRPIARLTRAAHEIGEAQDFSRRVPYAGPRDEVGRLAGTFNGMLGRLESAYARIQSALEAQRRFVADASHELRTPLTTIRGNVELLALDDEAESSDRREALEDIASEAERMSRLIADLLVLARADAGLHIQRGLVEVRPLVEEIYRQVRRTAGSVVFELGPIPDVAISGSADHLKQLLLILLDNAQKYSPPGGTVRLYGAQSNGWLQLSVSDEGPGIPKSEQERIFDRFYRLDLSRHGEGAGLGLSIARWIAIEHDGSLTVASSPGAGSTFTFALPIASEDSPRAETQQRMPAAVEP